MRYWDVLAFSGLEGDGSELKSREEDVDMLLDCRCQD
jgi:hypothetical protein